MAWQRKRERKPKQKSTSKGTTKLVSNCPKCGSKNISTKTNYPFGKNSRGRSTFKSCKDCRSKNKMKKRYFKTK